MFAIFDGNSTKNIACFYFLSSKKSRAGKKYLISNNVDRGKKNLSISHTSCKYLMITFYFCIVTTTLQKNEVCIFSYLCKDKLRYHQQMLPLQTFE